MADSAEREPRPEPETETETKAATTARDLVFSAVLFVVALLPRLYVAIAWAREPVWDGHYYDFGARRIAAGLGYSADVVIGGRTVWHPWCHYPVGYSGFLGLIYKLFGHGQAVAPVANAVTGALLAVVVHRLARYATTAGRARIAGLLAASSPGLIVYSALLMTEPLAGLGMLTAGWLFARDARAFPLRGAIAAGIALGLAILVRPQSLLCAPALGLIALARPGHDRRPSAPPPRSRSLLPDRAQIVRAAAAVGIATACALLVVAPWTIRNCRVMDGCALVSTNAGWNLAIGAFPRATGRFETLRSTDGCPVVTGQVRQDRCWMNEGLRWIRQDYGRWLGLMPQKLAYTFDHESFPMGYLGEANPAAWPPERQAKGRALLTASFQALLVLGALGVVARPSRGQPLRARVAQLGALSVVLLLIALAVMADAHPVWPLALAIPALAALPLPGSPKNGGVVGYLVFAIASVCITHAVFFGEDRYHMVATPALCILAACALRRPGEGPLVAASKESA